jgi:hypothetical protein
MKQIEEDKDDEYLSEDFLRDNLNEDVYPIAILEENEDQNMGEDGNDA